MSSPEEIVKEWLNIKGWKELYPAQQIALDKGLLETSSNFVVIVPTASGKTGVAEMAFLQMLKQGRRVAYLVPIHSLINEKRSEFDYLSGEFKIYPDEDKGIDFSSADLLIMTFELFYRNALLRPDIVDTFGLIIIDEFHILYDQLRGFNLEKVLTIIKQHKIRIICLSATFEKKEWISEWLDAIIIHIPKKHRSVDLKHGSIDLSDIPRALQVESLYRTLEEYNKYPAIIFCHRRNDTQSRAETFCEISEDNINSPRELREVFLKRLKRNSITKDENSLYNCMIKGIAFHHRGLKPELKTFIEEYFRDGKLKYLFATTGLAYGVNFPAKTVILYDLDWWVSRNNRMEKIPVYMYLQMAGRAGRPQFGDEGFAYVVSKDKEQLVKRIPEYLEGEIEEADSKIGIDDYFQKTILELIYSGKNKDDDIITFFEETYYNFLSQKASQILVPFNLFDIIKRHAEILYKNGFLVPEGAAGYRLTDLGEVTIDFLFNSFIQYELTPFMKLNRYLDKVGKVEHNFRLIYSIFRLFKEIRTAKKPRERSDEVDLLFMKVGIRNKKNISHPEYSSYATYYGWIENFDEVQIEDRFKVYAPPLLYSAREICKLLGVYKKLAEKKHFDIPQEFDILCDRIYYGVTEEELPFIRKRGIGRDTCRGLKEYSNNVLKRDPHNYTGTLLEILISLFKRNGEEGFMKIHVPYILGIGLKRAEIILSVVKEELKLRENTNS